MTDATHNVSSPLGQIKGTATVRDASGKVKFTFEFGGPATELQYNEVKEAVLPTMSTQENM